VEVSPEPSEPPVVVVVFVAVVEVDVVCAEAFSMLVSVGGMISGVLLGTGSETLAPPQPPIASTVSSIRPTSALRGVRAGWGALVAFTR
jgi:hypothetical protein